MKPARLPASRVAMLIGLIGLIAGPLPAQQHSVQQLEWKRPGERLEYHTCGCADDCWVAEVKSRHNGQVKLRLQSDCETIFLTHPGPPARRQTLDDHDGAFADERKFPAIIQTLERNLPPMKARRLRPSP